MRVKKSCNAAVWHYASSSESGEIAVCETTCLATKKLFTENTHISRPIKIATNACRWSRIAYFSAYSVSRHLASIERRRYLLKHRRINHTRTLDRTRLSQIGY